jgi:hypothetical protein
VSAKPFLAMALQIREEAFFGWNFWGAFLAFFANPNLHHTT